jgi:hypothetical protein
MRTSAGSSRPAGGQVFSDQLRRNVHSTPRAIPTVANVRRHAARIAHGAQEMSHPAATPTPILTATNSAPTTRGLGERWGMLDTCPVYRAISAAHQPRINTRMIGELADPTRSPVAS